MLRFRTYGFITSLLFLTGAAQAAISVTDDSGHKVTLDKPAQRIVSLAPHATELIYAAGAGATLVGVGEYSNYPPQAAQVQSIGSSAALDIERIVTLKPDLIIAWASGNSSTQVAKLRNLGIPVFDSEPRDFATIATTLERLARLAGTEATGNAAAATFRARLEKLTAGYRGRAPVRVFYQIWRDPLMSLNDEHLVSQALRLCGGENIFGKLPQLAPVISTEAVVQENPEVIITGSSKKGDDAFAGWRRFPKMTAVVRDNLFTIDSNLMSRAGPRVLEGTEAMCKYLDTARNKRK
jgi:iron complex transport system substrate-binding protein